MDTQKLLGEVAAQLLSGAIEVVDLSAPIFGPEGVAAALTSPYVETPTAISVADTVAAIQAAADEISVELGGQFQ